MVGHDRTGMFRVSPAVGGAYSDISSDESDAVTPSGPFRTPPRQQRRRQTSEKKYARSSTSSPSSSDDEASFGVAAAGEKAAASATRTKARQKQEPSCPAGPAAAALSDLQDGWSSSDSVDCEAVDFGRLPASVGKRAKTF